MSMRLQPDYNISNSYKQAAIVLATLVEQCAHVATTLVQQSALVSDTLVEQTSPLSATPVGPISLLPYHKPVMIFRNLVQTYSRDGVLCQDTVLTGAYKCACYELGCTRLQH